MQKTKHKMFHIQGSLLPNQKALLEQFKATLPAGRPLDPNAVLYRNCQKTPLLSTPAQRGIA